MLTLTGNSTYQNKSTLTGVMVFNATFNDISVISWRPLLLLEETKVPGKNVVSSTPRHKRDSTCDSVYAMILQYNPKESTL